VGAPCYRRYPAPYNELVARAIETTATVDERGHLQLDEPIPSDGPRRVRVIVLLPDDRTDDVPEHEWIAAAARNPAFDFLTDPREDVYSASDGQPFRDPR
jgi:hypothetical protein